MLIVGIFWVLGSVALVRGMALVSTAAGWITLGLLLIAMALWPMARSR